MNKKYISLIVLVFQAAAHALVVRYSRSRKGSSYDVGNAVLVSEIVKTLISLMFIVNASGLSTFKAKVRSNPIDCLKMSVPALIYLIQNNLIFYALSNLDAATFQILYQSKILTTALFSVFLLKKKINAQQWFSLFGLFIGVSVVQLSSSAPSESHSGNPNVGLLCIILAALTSGFSAIYVEKALSGVSKTLWERNLELASFSVAIGFANYFLFNTSERSLFSGFDHIVWLVIALQSGGGLLVGYVVKYADSIMKVFACSVAVVVSMIISVALFNLQLTMQFVAGAAMVMGSVISYSVSGSVKKSS